MGFNPRNRPDSDARVVSAETAFILQEGTFELQSVWDED